jgi:small subunit ribosomal protein S16
MAVKIRMKRMGAINQGSFRIVAADSRSPRDGTFIEYLGWYDPKKSGINFKMNLERVDYWKKQGAQMSDTVASLVKKARRVPAQ